MKLTAAIITGIACALLAMPLSASEIPPPEIDVQMMQTPPTIDGKLGKNEWAQAAKIPSFVEYMTGSNSLDHQTICWVGRGRDALYVAFECKDDNTGNIVRNTTQRDGMTWIDDSVEVFLSADPEARTYTQFCVDASGAQYDTRCTDGLRDANWDGYWVARTSVGKDAWYAELKIPYSMLGVTAQTKPSSTWRMNAAREYPERSGSAAEVSSWSPAMGALGRLHTPERFGSLEGMTIDPRYLALTPETSFEAPNRWLIGRNNLELLVENLSGSPFTAQVACIDPDTGAIIERHTARIAASSVTKLSMPITLPDAGEYERQYAVFDSAGAVISASRVLHARATKLDCTLISPAFRGNIQSKDPKKRIQVRGAVGIAGKHAWKVVATLQSVGKQPVWQKSTKLASAGTFEINRDASDLAVGDYSLDISLLDASGKSVASQAYPIKVLAPAPQEVTFDENRICYIDGKPFFPIGLFHVSSGALDALNSRAEQIGLPTLDLESLIKDVSAHGFNLIVNSWKMPDDHYLQLAKDSGLHVIPEVNCPSVAEFAKFRNSADRFRNILFWYGFDEPQGERMQSATQAHEQYIREDPHRPFAGAQCVPETFALGSEAFDILVMDPYFIGKAPLSTIGQWIDEGMSVTRRRKPIWVVPQAFAINDQPSEPTPTELRFQAYTSIVHGATGLIWYAYWTSEPWTKNQKGRNQWDIADTPLWPCFKALNGEIKSLVPVITTGKSLGRMAWSDESIQAAKWDYDGSRYIIAVNSVDKTIHSSVRVQLAKTADVLFENRKAGIRGGELNDDFGPLQVHVYKCD